jgi:glycosyltransferase involved in cell wall biosynthesis
MSPTVSVIIPTYNSGRLVVEAVQSVLAQTKPPAEIIVVDDGSSDDTRQRLQSYHRQVRYIYQENGGVSTARNRGIQEACGEVIAFLDADDVWLPRKLEIQLDVLMRESHVGLLGTRKFDWPTANLPVMDGVARPALVAIPWSDLVVKNLLVTSTVMVWRRVLDRVGSFDTTLRGPEDYDLWLRVAEVAEVANLELPLTGYRMVPGSLSKQAVSMASGMRRILQKLDERDAWRVRRWLRRKAYSYCDYSCAYMYGAAGSHRQALRHLLASLAWFPLPFRRREVKMHLARPKMLVMLLLRLLSLKPLPTPQGEGFPPERSEFRRCLPLWKIEETHEFHGKYPPREGAVLGRPQGDRKSHPPLPCAGRAMDSSALSPLVWPARCCPRGLHLGASLFLV